MPRRVLLAVNDRARRGQGASAKAEEALRALGHEVRSFPLAGKAPDALAKEIVARRDDVDCVMIGGGDGTLLGALPGLIESELPLIVFPLGTFNELARTLGVPADAAAVAALVDDGVPLPVDVGRVNGVPYFNEASIGLSTRVSRLQTGELKSRWGMLAIPLATVRALREVRPYRLDVETEDGTVHNLRTIQLTVANSYRFGGVVENPDASLEDGDLWLYAIEANSGWDLAKIVAAVALRRFSHAKNVLTLRGRTFAVRSRSGRAHRVFADSEEIATLPATFEALRGAVRILVPSDRVSQIR